MLYAYEITDGSEIRTAVPRGHHRPRTVPAPVGGLAAAMQHMRVAAKGSVPSGVGEPT